MTRHTTLLSRIRAAFDLRIWRRRDLDRQPPQPPVGIDPATLPSGPRHGLLVAFATPQSAPAIAYLRARQVQITRCANGLSACALAQSRRFDTIAVDVEHVDEYAPTLIHTLRDMPGPSARAWIVVFGTVIPGGLRQQLHAAGADMILIKRPPHDCAKDLSRAFGVSWEEGDV